MRSWLKFLIIVILALGIFFRFANLDQKVYRSDEVFSSMQMAGYSRLEINQNFSHGQVISVPELSRYQGFQADTDKGWLASLNTWSKDTHPPLYYSFLRIWSPLFGSSLASLRVCSVLLSLLVIPSVYWLSLELFGSPLVAVIATLLATISPFHIAISQEARMFGLWTVTTLLSCAALLRARRVNTFNSWLLYAITLTSALYSLLFRIIVAIVHGIYMLITEHFRLTKTLRSYLIASGAAFLAFSLWIGLVLVNFGEFYRSIASSGTVHQSFFSLVYVWSLNLTYLFVDFFNYFTYYPDSFWNWGWGKIIIPLVLFLVGYSIYQLIRREKREVWLFVILLIVVLPLVFIIADLMFGGYRSTRNRYWIPSYIGIEIAVAYLLARLINPINTKYWQQQVGKFLIVTLISLAVLSNIISSQVPLWWTKQSDFVAQMSIAQKINQFPQPLCMVRDVFDALAKIYLVNPDTQFLLINQPEIPKISDEYEHIFTWPYALSKNLLDQLVPKQMYESKLIYHKHPYKVWQLTKIKTQLNSNNEN